MKNVGLLNTFSYLKGNFLFDYDVYASHSDTDATIWIARLQMTNVGKPGYHGDNHQRMR